MASIIITNFNGLLDLEAYVRRRYKVNTRSRASDVGERMDSLQDFVKTQSGRDCVMEFENIMRLLPRVAIIRNPWLQTSEEVLEATIELYEDMIEQMPYMAFLESSSEFKRYYRKVSSKGRVMNSYFFSRRFMVFLDTPIANITMELTNPKLAGASIYLSTAVYENERTDDQEEIYFNIKTSLATEFSNEDVEFNYAAMFNYGKLTQYGRTHKHPNKYVTYVL
jgi:hypothetical protein